MNDEEKYMKDFIRLNIINYGALETLKYLIDRCENEKINFYDTFIPTARRLLDECEEMSKEAHNDQGRL